MSKGGIGIMESHFVVKRPIITEKSQMAKEKNNEYTFEVDKRANKPVIRKAIEDLFGVKVVDIKTSLLKPYTKMRQGRKYKTSYVKKAVVKLLSGNEIEYS